MALIQSQAKAPGTGGRAQFVGMALTVAVLIVAAAMVAVLASSLTAKSTGGSIVTTKADPLVQQGAIQFRAAEHAAGAAAGDPLLQTSAIQFRAAERAAGAAAVDPFSSRTRSSSAPTSMRRRRRAHRVGPPSRRAPGRRGPERPQGRLVHDQPAGEVARATIVLEHTQMGRPTWPAHLTVRGSRPGPF